MKQSLFLFVFLVAVTGFSFRPADGDKVNWITMQQLNDLYAKEPRPILIDIYTDWCGWCKEMDRTTYKNDKLATYINDHFYAVKYNAESRDDISFNNRVFKYVSQYRTNELAIYLTGGRLSFPTTVFLATSNAAPAPLSGYLKAKEMEAPLKYFGEKANETESFPAFNKRQHPDW